ncbi:IclR family transcriptional regulator [Paraburkholderia hospita]|jgi:DNA-binding IclR family transcriptional regulator|uniref:IclR family transcriptional regulator n=1 Tax=Paraburkholderia hospita TaxID=169430 RepID=UPI0002717AD7|nr:IclR family transcriptional regulator [Paraburkholderia hospita]EUC14972.1 transcriptional regulator, IclR family [Burkholderia sp. BT03]SOE91051.1 transcriptional regulator, IclR family [Burkholderia sp. YR290]AXF04196.1 IclR family transcriptional regulator [Paraburkholderia hospita]SKD00018.1 transcriptional regulator, IclR family [Paraburkholderia hospita]SKD03192.1 transcriptional regulator, IclR family [Paraburkholderia hospita]
MPTPAADALEAARATGTAAFSKFMSVLQLIADAKDAPSVPQLAAASGFPRPTVYRIVGALMAEGLVVESLRGGTFELGPRLMTLASRSWERSDVRVAAADALQALRDATQETVHLAVRSGSEMVYIEKLESPHAVRMASRIGTRVTLYSSSVGKAYLAALDDAARDALLEGLTLTRFTANTIVEPDALRAELDETRERGYAEDREENEPQIFCYGCAIRAADGLPIACISVSIPLFRRNDTPLETYVEPLRAACAAVAERLGPAPRSAG